MDAAGEADGAEFAEVVAAAGGAGLEVDAGDRVVAAAVAGRAGERRVLAVDGEGGGDADLRDGVAVAVVGADVAEGVEAAGVRGGRDVDRVAAVVGAGKADDGPLDAVAGGEDAVVVRVVVDAAGERAGQQFAEAVVRAVVALVDVDGGDLVVAGDAVGERPVAVLSVEVAGGVRKLRDRVAGGVGGAERREAEQAAAGGGCCDVDDAPAVVGAGEADLHAVDAGLRGVLEAVVVRVVVDDAGEAGVEDLPEVVAGAVRLGAGGERDGVKLVVRGCVAAGGAELLVAVEVAGRLRGAGGVLDDAVGAGAEVVEQVRAGGGVAGGVEDDVVAEVVDADQPYGDAAEARLAGVFDAVVVRVVPDEAGQGVAADADGVRVRVAAVAVGVGGVPLARVRPVEGAGVGDGGGVGVRGARRDRVREVDGEAERDARPGGDVAAGVGQLPGAGAEGGREVRGVVRRRGPEAHAGQVVDGGVEDVPDADVVGVAEAVGVADREVHGDGVAGVREVHVDGGAELLGDDQRRLHDVHVHAVAVQRGLPVAGDVDAGDVGERRLVAGVAGVGGDVRDDRVDHDYELVVGRVVVHRDGDLPPVERHVVAGQEGAAGAGAAGDRGRGVCEGAVEVLREQALRRGRGGEDLIAVVTQPVRQTVHHGQVGRDALGEVDAEGVAEPLADGDVGAGGLRAVGPVQELGEDGRLDREGGGGGVLVVVERAALPVGAGAFDAGRVVAAAGGGDVAVEARPLGGRVGGQRLVRLHCAGDRAGDLEGDDPRVAGAVDLRGEQVEVHGRPLAERPAGRVAADEFEVRGRHGPGRRGVADGEADADHRGRPAGGDQRQRVLEVHVEGVHAAGVGERGREADGVPAVAGGAVVEGGVPVGVQRDGLLDRQGRLDDGHGGGIRVRPVRPGERRAVVQRRAVLRVGVVGDDHAVADGDRLVVRVVGLRVGDGPKRPRDGATGVGDRRRERTGV